MGYRLVITEKPSVASAIAKVIGAKERKDGYFQGGGYLVSWCVGHLVELAMPQAYDEKYGKWRKEDLPILPKKWKYQIYQSTKKQFQTLKSLMARNNRSIGGSEQRDPLPCPRAFYVSVENVAAGNGIDCGSTCRNFSKSNVGNTRNEKSRAGRVFYLPALLCTILVQDGKEGDADAL